ncbi:MAG: hypothetical protein LBR19_03120 [Bifidobacteriaceae bacterium]|nr:hypothetical protein [Bifidobacteriaceae bacterium]
MAAAGLVQLLLADARLPVGGHTQSGSLEPALRAGLAVAEIPGYVTARLLTVTRTAAGVAVLARAAVAGDAAMAPDGGLVPDGAGVLPRGGPGLAAIWRHWEAATPAHALRAAEVTLGRGYRRLGERLWGQAVAGPLAAAVACYGGLGDLGGPGDSGGAAVAGGSGGGENASQGEPAHEVHPPRPLVLGVIAAAAGLTAEQTAAVVGYDDVQTVWSACAKLAPGDPVDLAQAVLTALPLVAAMAADLAGLSSLADLPVYGAPQIDQWATAHSQAQGRLFHA